MNKKVNFYTLGCKVNQYETNGMTQKFIDAGYEIVEMDEPSDICVVNTCTVTNMSDRKSRQVLRRMKEKNNNIIVVAVGCYAQVAKEELESYDEIDLVLGNNEKNAVVEYMEKYINEKHKINEVTDVMMQREFVDFGTVTYTEKTRAVIKVQDGCDRFCSYCIIPYARGRVRSREPQSIINEITDIAKNGIKEVVITGIHIASYGRDFKNDYRLIELLEDLNKIDGIERIRLGSLEPTLITEDFLERLVKLNKICHHFHLSLQSGCTKTLQAMNRKYTTDEFENIVKLLREVYKDVILTTDIIVGFPGETDEDFNETYEFLKRIKFYKMHVFKYSPRKGTKAADMKEQVDGNIKEKRSRVLLELSDKNEAEYNKEYIGKEVEVLFEEKDGSFYKGHTKNYIMVWYETEENLENSLKQVKIKKAEKDHLLA